MKKLFTLTILLLTFWTTGKLCAQVTIGSRQEPNPGALLDLKMEGATTKGMAMPRVELKDQNKLTMGDNVIDDKPSQSGYSTVWKDHLGLMVYNTSHCDGKFAQGLYIWDGAQWKQVLDKPIYDTPSLSITGITGDFVEIPSGLDARGTNIPVINLNVVHNNEATLLPIANDATANTMFAIMPPWVSGTVQNLSTSPLVYSLQANKMTSTNFPNIGTTNPWRSREWKLKYTVAGNDCGAAIEKTIIMNQTNYALQIDGSTIPTEKVFAANANNQQLIITGNTQWKVTLTPATNSAISGLSPALGSTQGSELNNGTSKTTIQQYSITVGSGLQRYNYLIFADTKTPKRFADITQIIAQCHNTGKNPQMHEWAAIAGFPNVAITKVSEADDIAKKRDQPHSTTGIAWHRDQDGNIFLSSSFHSTNITGDSERWMITNLAATKYDATRTDGSTLISPNSIVDSYKASYIDPHKGYPNINPSVNDATNATTYNNDPRVGLLYNWAAATMKKGGADGKASFTEGETTTGENHAKVQGICPKGWHLPSDKELTALEREFNTNTMTYSSATANANATITADGTHARRGPISDPNSHANAMKDICEPISGTYKTQGISNPISTMERPGFGWMLTGGGHSGTAGYFGAFGTYGYVQSASGDGTNDRWSRSINNSSAYSGAYHYRSLRSHLFSVRCKKD